MTFKISAGLFIYSSYAREHLAFDSLEEGTTAGRDVRNLVGKTELGAACYRVAAADE